MKTIKLKKIGEQLPMVSNVLRDINAGGCGYFAEHLYHLFIKIGVKPKLCLITRQIVDRKNANYNFNHIILKVGKYYYDNRGRNDKEKLKYILNKAYWNDWRIHEVEIDLLFELNNNGKEMYNCYFRKRNRTYKKTLKNFFENLENTI